MRVLSFDGHPLSGEAIPFYAYFSPERSPHTVSIQRRARHRRASVRESIEINPKEYTVRVWPKETGFNITTQTFYTQISDIFSLYRDSRWLVVEWDEGGKDDHEVITTQLLVDVVSIALEDDESFIDIRVEATDPRWRSSIPSSGPPFDVNGNVEVFPVLTVTGGEALDRYRVNIRDTTGQGLGSELVYIPWEHSASQTLVYNNGMSQPFRVAGGNLWIRVDAQPNETVFADVYQGSAIDNVETANTMDTAGLNLETSTMKTLRYQSWAIERHPLAATNSWRPGRIIKHPNGRPYTFGLTDPSIAEFTLVDRITRGQRWDLADDYDSAIMLSNVSLEQLSGTQLEIFAGYTTFLDEIELFERHRWTFSFHWAHSGSVTLAANGQTTTIDAPFQGIMHGVPVAGAPWIMNVVTPAIHELYGAANVDIMASINNAHNGGASIRIEFKGALADMEVPVAQVTSNTLARHPEFGGHAISVTTDRIASPGVTFPEDEEDSPGWITAFIAIADRNESSWREVWEQKVKGIYPIGQTITVSPVVNLLESHRVAIGIRAASTNVDDFNFGRLTIKGTPIVTRKESELPDITVSEAIPARIKDGQIHSLTTGERIVLKRRITDDVPLIIDCDQRTAQAESGPEYTEGTDRTDPNSWLTFRPGLNEIDVPADWTLTAEWHDRWEI